MSPVVSIIIATFNSGECIRTALESVLNQEFKEWECIVIDGASKDNTIDIVKQFVAKDNRFRYISEPDNGVYDAFNKGWRIAKGEWIHYLGSDDKLTKESFTALLKADDGKAAVISGSAYIEKIDDSITLQPSKKWDGCHQAKITRKSVLERYNGFDEQYRIVADTDLYERMKHNNESVINVNTPVAYFSMKGMSQSLSNFNNRKKELLKIYHISFTNLSPLGKWLYSYMHFVMSYFYRYLRAKLKLAK